MKTLKVIEKLLTNSVPFLEFKSIYTKFYTTYRLLYKIRHTFDAIVVGDIDSTKNKNTNRIHYGWQQKKSIKRWWMGLNFHAFFMVSPPCMETCLGKCLSFISSKFISQIFMCESTTRIYIITLFMLQRSCNHYCTHFQRIIRQDTHSLKILQQNVYDQFNDLLRPSMTTNYVLFVVFC